MGTIVMSVSPAAAKLPIVSACPDGVGTVMLQHIIRQVNAVYNSLVMSHVSLLAVTEAEIWRSPSRPLMQYPNYKMACKCLNMTLLVSFLAMPGSPDQEKVLEG